MICSSRSPHRLCRGDTWSPLCSQIQFKRRNGLALIWNICEQCCHVRGLTCVCTTHTYTGCSSRWRSRSRVIDSRSYAVCFLCVFVCSRVKTDGSNQLSSFLHSHRAELVLFVGLWKQWDDSSAVLWVSRSFCQTRTYVGLMRTFGTKKEPQDISNGRCPHSRFLWREEAHFTQILSRFSSSRIKCRLFVTALCCLTLVHEAPFNTWMGHSRAVSMPFCCEEMCAANKKPRSGR